MNKQHSYAHILRAIAEGEDIQFYYDNPHAWYNKRSETVLQEVANCTYPPNLYRIKPDTIRIGNTEVPEPMRVTPSLGEAYFLVSIDKDRLVTESGWDGAEIEKQRLSRGLIHRTWEDARTHAKALLSFTRVQ